MRLLQSRVASDPVQVPTRLPPGSSSGPYSPGPGRVLLVLWLVIS
jgi:hypothetical protein